MNLVDVKMVAGCAEYILLTWLDCNEGSAPLSTTDMFDDLAKNWCDVDSSDVDGAVKTKTKSAGSRSTRLFGHIYHQLSTSALVVISN